MVDQAGQRVLTLPCMALGKSRTRWKTPRVFGDKLLLLRDPRSQRLMPRYREQTQRFSPAVCSSSKQEARQSGIYGLQELACRWASNSSSRQIHPDSQLPSQLQSPSNTPPDTAMDTNTQAIIAAVGIVSVFCGCCTSSGQFRKGNRDTDSSRYRRAL